MAVAGQSIRPTGLLPVAQRRWESGRAGNCNDVYPTGGGWL